MGDMFDDLLEAEFSSEKEEKPLWKIGLSNDEEVLKWLNNEFDYLRKQNGPRFEKMKENIGIYKGTQYRPHDRTTINDFLNVGPKKKRNSHKLIVNHLYDITETIVARSTRNKVSPDIYPANSEEYEDRTNARLAKKLADHIAYINKLPEKHVKLKRHSILCGEAYLLGEWNKHGGDIHPMWAEAKEHDFIDEKGNPVKGPDGKPMKMKDPVMVGEVELSLMKSWRVLVDDKEQWDDVEHFFIVEIEQTEKIIKDYPASKNKIKKSDSAYAFEVDTMQARELRDECIKVTFYRKKDRFMPKGAKVVFTKDCILEKGDFPFSLQNKLNLVRLTDVEVEDQLNAESFYEWTKEIQFRHNQLSSDIIKHQRLCAHPKWMVPKGRCKLEQLGDDTTVVQFQGPVPPKLAVMAPNPPEVFTFRKELKEDLEQISTVTGTSRRDPPTGVTASVSLKYLSELEAERVIVSTSKDNEFIKEVYGLMLAIAGDKYDENDGRTVRVLGKGDYLKISSLKNANFSKSYDIRIGNSDVLPETQTGKMAAIFDLIDRKPDILPDEQLLDALNLGSTEKIEDILTASLKAAEAENEDFLDGEPVEDPQEFEEHITHWNSHVSAMQSRGFKKYAPEANKMALIEHIQITEFLMVEKAKVNPLFQAKLAQLPLFPIFWFDGFVPQSREQQANVVQGQANRGEQISAQIPGEDLALMEKQGE